MLWKDMYFFFMLLFLKCCHQEKPIFRNFLTTRMRTDWRGNFSLRSPEISFRNRTFSERKWPCSNPMLLLKNSINNLIFLYKNFPPASQSPDCLAPTSHPQIFVHSGKAKAQYYISHTSLIMSPPLTL